MRIQSIIYVSFLPVGVEKRYPILEIFLSLLVRLIIVIMLTDWGFFFHLWVKSSIHVLYPFFIWVVHGSFSLICECSLHIRIITVF